MNLYNDKCENILPTLSSQSIDAVICDEPYGTTACSWDEIIEFNFMWKELNRIIKPNGAIVLFGSMPFTARLVCSNITQFKYEWIWQKAVGSNFSKLKYQPMKEHESILVFGKHNYYPIKEIRKGTGALRLKAGYKSNTITGETTGSITGNRTEQQYDDLRFPSSVQFFNNREKCRGLHPTQKPVALMEYLVKTYTLEGQTVLDFAMGSGTTGVACKNLNRDFVGIEMVKEYFDIAEKRINNVLI